MTLAWLVTWLIANNIGAHEALTLDPVNAWVATLVLAVGVDLNRPQNLGRRSQQATDGRAR